MLLHDGASEDWSQYVLVVPVVSVGNVGQLAADLLISTLELGSGSVLHHDTLLPTVGAAAFSRAPGLTFGLEMFFDPARRLACLQQRAPAAPGLQLDLAQATAAWITQAGFKQVWVLGSLDAVFRTDAQLAGPQLRYWSADASLSSTCATQGLPALEAEWFQRSGDIPLEQRLLPPWPLLRGLQAAGVPCAALLIFALEGDNRPEAYTIAGVAARALGIVNTNGEQPQPGRPPEQVAAGAGGGLAWRPPSSWEFAFGRSDRPELY